MAVEIGQKYQSLKAMRVKIYHLLAAPMSDWGTGILPAGEIIIVTDIDWYDGDTLCTPENYDALHLHFVSQETQDWFNHYAPPPDIYKGYRLQIPPTILIEQFEPVE